MVAGVPVLSTLVGELVYSVLDGKTGYHVQHGDYKGIAIRIEELARRPIDMHRMGSQARLFVLKRFSKESFLTRIQVIMDQLELQYVKRI
ncbi:glycosyltransferase [Swingsia samuiensis]